MTIVRNGSAAAVLAAISALASCGGNNADDMSVGVDLRTVDLAVVVEGDLSHRDMAMGMGDMAMRDMAVASMEDMSVLVMDDMTRPDDGPLVSDASVGDAMRMMGDIGISDAIMDGPGRLADTPNCTGAPTGACQVCIGMNCANQVVAAFGANWQTKDTGSACDGVYACSCTCMNGGGNNCLQTCVQQKGGQCVATFNPFATCVMNNCANPCK